MNDAEMPTNGAILIYNLLMSICDLENRRKVRKPINVPYNFGRINCFVSINKNKQTNFAMYRSICDAIYR